MLQIGIEFPNLEFEIIKKTVTDLKILRMYATVKEESVAFQPILKY